MTRNELITKWCAAEGGKVSALDAPQAREAYAKLRKIIGYEVGIDLDDVIDGRSICIDATGLTRKASHFEAFPVFAWRSGKPLKAARK